MFILLWCIRPSGEWMGWFGRVSLHIVIESGIQSVDEISLSAAPEFKLLSLIQYLQQKSDYRGRFSNNILGRGCCWRARCRSPLFPSSSFCASENGCIGISFELVPNSSNHLLLASQPDCYISGQGLSVVRSSISAIFNLLGRLFLPRFLFRGGKSFHGPYIWLKFLTSIKPT